jgi:rfaE bifunctional protein kinase chain/domain
MTIAVVGDLILDKYVIGQTSRISPEAPVPIVNVTEEKYTLGGAANVANNLISLDCPVLLVGAVGKDRESKVMDELCIAKKIETDFYSVDTVPTTNKTRIISRNQQMMRVDREGTFLHTPKSLEHYKKSFSSQDIIVVSDYAKGFCSPELIELIFTQKLKNCKVLVDPKGINWEKYNGAFLVKPNIAELEEVLAVKINNDDEELANMGRKAFEKYNFDHLVITRGNKGMTHIYKNGVAHYKTQNVEVYDVSGAGDTAMAVMAKSLMEGLSIEAAIVNANIASSYVVTKPMTYAISKAEFEKLF